MQLVLLYRNGKNRKVIYAQRSETTEQCCVSRLLDWSVSGKVDVSYNSLRGYRQRVGVWCKCFRYAVLLSHFCQEETIILCFQVVLIARNQFREASSYIFIYTHYLPLWSSDSQVYEHSSRDVTRMFLAERLSSIISAFQHWINEGSNRNFCRISHWELGI